MDGSFIGTTGFPASGSILEQGPVHHVAPAMESFMAKLDATEVAALLAEYGRRSALRGGKALQTPTAKS
jgi:hypothetical protein